MTPDKINWYSEDKATLGDRLSAAREAGGLTSGDVAKRLGVTTTTYDAWENDSKEPRANRLQMLSGMLGTSLRWLLTGEGTAPAQVDDNAVNAAQLRRILAELSALRATMTDVGAKICRVENHLQQVIRTS